MPKKKLNPLQSTTCASRFSAQVKSELAALCLQMDLINIQNSCSVNTVTQTQNNFNKDVTTSLFSRFL